MLQSPCCVSSQHSAEDSDYCAVRRNGRHVRLVPRGLHTVSASTASTSRAGMAHDFIGASGGLGLHLGPRSVWPGAELRAGSAPVNMEASVWQAIQADDAAHFCVSLGDVRVASDPLSVATGDSRGLSVGSGGWDGSLWAASPGSGVKRKSCDLAAAHRPFTTGEAFSPDRHRIAGEALSPNGQAVQHLGEAMQVQASTPDVYVFAAPEVWHPCTWTCGENGRHYRTTKLNCGVVCRWTDHTAPYRTSS